MKLTEIVTTKQPRAVSSRKRRASCARAHGDRGLAGSSLGWHLLLVFGASPYAPCGPSTRTTARKKKKKSRTRSVTGASDAWAFWGQRRPSRPTQGCRLALCPMRTHAGRRPEEPGHTRLHSPSVVPSCEQHPPLPLGQPGSFTSRPERSPQCQAPIPVCSRWPTHPGGAGQARGCQTPGPSKHEKQGRGGLVQR